MLSEALAVADLSLAPAAAVALPIMTWLRDAPPSLAWISGEVMLTGALVAPDLRVEYDTSTWFRPAAALMATALAGGLYLGLYPAVRAAATPPADTLSGL